MREEVEIAPATLADVDAIDGLEKAAFPAPWRREFFESELRNAGRFNLVARRGKKIIGYVFSMWFLDEMHINKIAVDESERRRGVAFALMEACNEFAIRNGVTTIALEVRESNSGAQAFYRRLGFASSYVRPRYYPDGEAAVVMTRAIG